MMNLPERVSICEVGLRDGVQNEKVYPNTDQKIEILRGFIDAGYKVIEVGSFMHPKRVP
ncbi:MAG: hydroxymethylglutaryl-CoA lyase, partial [Synergistaceae bacterium]|nr:hydroxymethylglutaryl-CoA lyase [Synergistaceae bacterium]